MDIKAPIISQYLAALEMMKQVVSKCPDDVWRNPSHTNQFWHIAYHALFYVHLYLQPEETNFTPWVKSRPNLNFMGQLPWPPHDKVALGEPYSQNEVLEYLALCQQEVQTQTSNLNIEAPSGFSWIPLSKLELQFYNIRHLQLHVGELAERLWVEARVEVGWVGQYAKE